MHSDWSLWTIVFSFSLALQRSSSFSLFPRLAFRLPSLPRSSEVVDGQLQQSCCGQHHQQQDKEQRKSADDTMGLTTSSPPQPLTERQRAKQKKLERSLKKRTAELEFENQLLHPSFLQFHPARPEIMVTAQQYATNNDAATLMPGTHKHLGGAYDPTDGCIYGVPANSQTILCMYPDTNNNYHLKSIPLPKHASQRTFKWLRGIVAHGNLWAIPSWADHVLCVDLDAHWGRRDPPPGAGIVQLIDLPAEHKAQTWQWHGAGINHEQTAIFCIPSNAQHVLKVDIIAKSTNLIPIEGFDPRQYPNFDTTATNKWYGGIVGADNCVYGIPYRACAVLKIDCERETATLIGKDYGSSQFNWHGGIKVKGKIYAHPSHADTVLVIDTNTKDDTKIYELPIKRTDSDPCRTYKWLGGSTGADGNIYCPACDTSAVLKIDVLTETCTTFGFAGHDKNKWQGGVLARDGCIYCIPASGKHVCRILTQPGLPNVVQLLGDLPATKDKWQGSHSGLDGCLYFVPENGYRVLKVTPPNEPPTLLDGKLPASDVKLDFL